jgi:replication-associated recombination protein RarA
LSWFNTLDAFSRDETVQMAAVNDKLKSMSDNDMKSMLDQMSQMGSEEEARLKQMGVDPAMMKKSVEMMKANPLMMKAAQAMMSKMSPDQLRAASQQAQKQMAGMSKEEYANALEKMRKGES